MQHFGSPGEVLAQSVRSLAQVVDYPLAGAIARGPNPDLVQGALRWAEHPQRALLTLDDPRYPELLKELADPPPLMYAAGRVELASRVAVAIVGSRNATAQGMRDAEAFARALSRSGVTIVSGLALGIDAAAHRGALEADGAHGSTIAVLGNGIDVAYPRGNAELFERMCTAGLALSEFHLGTPPVASNFPRRNRIISGIARGCLVIEAALASGSLITARLAADAGRDVFAIPGSIHSPLSRGCHHLIKQGAKLVERAEDVLEELGLVAGAAETPSVRDELSAEAEKIIAALEYHPCDVDTLVTRTKMPIERLLAALMRLELESHVARNSDGTYQRLR